MKKLVMVMVIVLLLAGCKQVIKPALAEIVLKEGVSYSTLDSNFENVALIEFYRLPVKDEKSTLWNNFSLNGGLRSIDTAILDIGYDLGKFVEPLKELVKNNPYLKPFSPILELVNPSVDGFVGYKRPFDDWEFDAGVNVVAIKFKW